MDPAETTLLAGGPSTGDESGRGSAASLKFPSSIALLPGPQPWLALADRGNHRLKFIGLEGARHGRCAQLAGAGQHGYRDGHWHTSLFNEPVSVAVSSCGQALYVADKGNHCVRAVWVGSGRPSDTAPTPNSGRGPDWENSGRLATTTPSAASGASLGTAETSVDFGGGGSCGEGTGSQGSRFVCTLAGMAGVEGCADGVAGDASFSSPCAVAVEPGTGAVLVVDKGNNRIRRIVLPSANPWPAACEGLRAGAATSTRTVAFPDAVVQTLPLVCSRTGAQWNLQRPFCLAALPDRTVLVGDHSQPPRSISGGAAGAGRGGRAGSSAGSLLRLFLPLPQGATTAAQAQETSAGAAANAVRAARRISAATSRQESARSVCVRRIAEGCSLGLLSFVACGPQEPLARDWKAGFASDCESALNARCISVLVCERQQGQLVELCLPHYADMGEIRAVSDSDSDSDSDSGDGHMAKGDSNAATSNSGPPPCAMSVLRLPLTAAGPPLTREPGESLSLLHGKPGSQAAMSAVVISHPRPRGDMATSVKVFLADTYRHRVLVSQLRGARTAAERAEAEAAARAGNTAPAPALLQPMARTQRVEIVGRPLPTPPAHTVAGLCAAVANKSAPASWARGALDDMRALSRGKERALLRRTGAMKKTAAPGGSGARSTLALDSVRDDRAKEGAGVYNEAEQMSSPAESNDRVSLLESASAPVIGRAHSADRGNAGDGTRDVISDANVVEDAAAEHSIEIAAHANAPTWVRNATQEAAARRRAAAAAGTGSQSRNPFGAAKAAHDVQTPDSAICNNDYGTATGAGDELVPHSIRELQEFTHGVTDAAPKSVCEPEASVPVVEVHSGTLPTSWTKGDVLGAGAFGTVYLCHDGNSGCFFALKEIERAALGQCDAGSGDMGDNAAAHDNLGMSLVPSRSAHVSSGQCEVAEKTEGLAELQSEISILRSLRHPNIVGYYGARISSAENGTRGSHVLQIFLEYVPGGSLRSLLSQVNPNFTSDGLGAFRRYLRGLLHGLHFLHTREPPVVHGDVKAANVLLDPTTAAVKIADFGCAVRLQRVVDSGGGSAAGVNLDATAGGAHTKAQVGITGSVPWMAPEVANESGFGAAADIWSLGCTMIEMITSARPWPRYTTQVSLLLHLVTGKDTPLDASAETADGGQMEAADGQDNGEENSRQCIAALAPACCRTVRDLVGRCLRRDADTRWSCAQLMQHEFLAE